MAASAQYPVGSSTPVLLASCPAPGPPGPSGWFYLSNTGSAAVTLLGSAVNTGAGGPTVAAGGTLSGFLFSGDTLYGLATSGTQTVAVLQTGA